MIDLNNPALRQALTDVENMNTPHKWADLEVIDFPREPIIRISSGWILSDGTREAKLVTHHYTMRKDKVEVTYYVHS